MDRQILKTASQTGAVLLGIGCTVAMNANFAIAQLYPQPAQMPPSLNGELVPLDAQPMQPTSPLQPNKAESTSSFSFTNMLEYGDCLEVILKLYGNSSTLTAREQQSLCFKEIQAKHGDSQLSKSDALQLISAADFYATTLLARDLYPPRGQRARIASLFGFIYAVDINDSQIRDLAAPASADCPPDASCI